MLDLISNFLYELIASTDITLDGVFVAVLVLAVFSIGILLCKPWRVKADQKSDVFSSAMHMVSAIISAISMLVIATALITQDPLRASKEAFDPIFFYLIFSVCFISCFIFSVLGKRKNNAWLNTLASLLLLILALCFIEFPYEASHYFNRYNHIYGLAYYKNYTLVQVLDYILIVSACLVFAVNAVLTSVFLIKRFISPGSSNYASSIKYREKCYNRVAKMKEYLDKGIITEEEYEKNKQEILKNVKL